MECWIDPEPGGAPRSRASTLRPGYESFVGAGAMPMRHGLTLGELGHWFIKTKKLDVDYRVIEMDDYDPYAGPGFDGRWVSAPGSTLSPNAPNASTWRAPMPAL